MRKLTESEKGTILLALDLYSQQGSHLENDKQIEAAERVFAAVELHDLFIEEPKQWMA